jgi:hypothetical protein
MNNKCVWIAALVVAAAAHVVALENVTLFRVFLNDGTAVVSYGEFARVGDRVVFSMPIGAGRDDIMNLQVVNIPASASHTTSRRTPNRITRRLTGKLRAC